MMIMQSKFHELLGRAGVSTATVARETGIPYSTLNEWRKGKTRKISLENLTKIANYFGVSLAYFNEDGELSEEQAESLKQSAMKQIHEVSGGPGRIDNFLDKYDDEGQLARVVGDSMAPALLDGDVVRFVEAAEVGPTDFALVRIDGEALTVKHVEWTGEGLWIRAENKDVFEDRFYNVREIATIPVQIVGKAVEVRRML